MIGKTLKDFQRTLAIASLQVAQPDLERVTVQLLAKCRLMIDSERLVEWSIRRGTPVVPALV